MNVDNDVYSSVIAVADVNNQQIPAFKMSTDTIILENVTVAPVNCL